MSSTTVEKLFLHPVFLLYALNPKNAEKYARLHRFNSADA
jgi:hypothetical protein